MCMPLDGDQRHHMHRPIQDKGPWSPAGAPDTPSAEPRDRRSRWRWGLSTRGGAESPGFFSLSTFLVGVASVHKLRPLPGFACYRGYLSSWCSCVGGGGATKEYLQSMAGSAVCQGTWAGAAAAGAAPLPRGHCPHRHGCPCSVYRRHLHLLFRRRRHRYHYQAPRRSGSCLGTRRHVAGPSCEGSACTGCGRQRTCCPGRGRLRAR